MRRNEVPKLVVFSLAFLFIPFCVSSALGQRGGDLGKPAELKAELKMYKTGYLLREPIWVNIEVTNIGDEDGWFYFNSRTGLVIEDSKGQRYPCRTSGSQFPATIRAGETLEDKFDLLVDYGASDNEFKLFSYLPPERYTVFYSVRKGVRTKTDTFSVSAPTDEELMAMDLVKKSYDLFLQRKWNESISILDSVVADYPNSVYAPHSLLQMAKIYAIALENDPETITTYRKLLDTYPNSWDAVGAALPSLVHFYNTKPDEPGLVKYLTDLIKKHPETAVAKEAQKELAKINE